MSVQTHGKEPIRQRTFRRRTFRRHMPFRLPSDKLEYGYYFAVTYSVLGPALGLEIPMLAGVMILAIWFLCVRQVQSWKVFAPISLLIICAVLFLMIQVLVHGESI